MKSIVLYGHEGSLNHGCEAIVRGTKKIIENTNIEEVTLLSNNPDTDIKYGIDKICNIRKVSTNNIKKKTFSYYIKGLKYKVFNDRLVFERFRNKSYEGKFDNKYIAMSIGGDNYCYDKPRWLFYLNKLAKKRGAKTVLWGCSIEPKYMDSEMIEDLKRYDLIVPRESITYNALLNNGVNKNTKLYPDPAFQLGKIELELPEGFIEGNTIGINLSPLIIKCENKQGATFENFKNLIEHIIETTDSNIALIPHVTWEHNNDEKPLNELYQIFKDTGRIVLLETNYNAMELKGFISRCRMFIGARTHATIAAYSTCVPTLVVGYSVKALGIARDIFGSEENMVIPVQSLKNKSDLINAYEYIKVNEYIIKKYLEEFIPIYNKKSLQASYEIEKLLK